MKKTEITYLFNNLEKKLLICFWLIRLNHYYADPGSIENFGNVNIIHTIIDRECL